MVKTVLDYRAAINAKTKYGNTALLEVCHAQGPAQVTIAILHLHLKHGARTNRKKQLK